MAQAPAFASTPRAEYVNIATANTNRDGSGSPSALITGVAAGTRVEEIHIQAAVSTTAGMVRVFISLDAGTTYRLIDEIPVSAITVGANTPGFRTIRRYTNLLLRDASAKLAVTTHNSESINVVAFGGDLT